MTSPLNLPNGLTLAGYAAHLAWLSGAPDHLAVLALLCDELDGRVARATGTATAMGSALDWGADVTLTAMMLEQLGARPAAPLVLGVQAMVRGEGYRPPVGSLRALLTLALMAKRRSARKR